MGHILGNGNPNINFTIYPGHTVRHSYWWDGQPLGNGPWTGCPMPPSIATQANPVVVVGNGMRATPTVTYYVDVTCDDESGTGGAGAYRLYVGQLS